MSGRKCKRCAQMKSEAEFGLRFIKYSQTWVPFANCAKCRQFCRNFQAQPEQKEKLSKIYKTDEYRSSQQERRSTPEEYEKSKMRARNLGPEKRRRQKTSPAHIAYIKRMTESRRHDLQHRLCTALRQRIRDQLLGSNKVSATLTKYCTWATSPTLLREHFRSKYKPGMRDWNYGSFWNIGHSIPVFYYDFEDVEDVNRCNSIHNLMCDYVIADTNGCLSNNQKGNKIMPNVKDQCSSSYPKSWNGRVPTAKELIEIVKSIRLSRKRRKAKIGV